MDDNKIFWCTNCLNMSTRPRISFDNRGWCNACQWMEEKQSMDWSARQAELEALLDSHRSSAGKFDCIVPVSGGKDGSYVAHTLKHKYGMNPLTVTVQPALPLPLGDQNLRQFIQSGYNHIQVSAQPLVLDKLNKFGFIEKGFPYYGWLIAIMTAVIRVAINFNIPLIFYAEDGEIEYGGSTEKKHKALYDIHYMREVYLESGYDVVHEKLQEEGVHPADLTFFQFPDEEEVKRSGLVFTHWSYFENWDSYRNYVVAKEHCGLVEKEVSNDGTFSNFAQNDQALYSLHAYLMYLKFGFGRATQDAGIEIRRGAMTREQAVHLVRLYDNAYPHAHIQQYLDYYGMSKPEFDAVLDKYANKQLFRKEEGIWQPMFTVGETFSLEEEAFV